MLKLNPHGLPGAFLVFEGINGCGKSVQAVRMHNWLRSLKVAVSSTKEPTTDFIGRQIRRALEESDLMNALGPSSLQSWYALDSLQHLQEKVIPALGRGEVVISDRYRPSLVHSALHEGDINLLTDLNVAILKENFILPDVTFIFDTTPEVAVGRLARKGGALDLQENAPEITRTRERYLQLARIWPNTRVIDAQKEEKEVFVEIRGIVAGLLHLSDSFA